MQAEVTGFIIAVNVVLLILIGGIVFFVVQYRRRRKSHEMETSQLHKSHSMELLSVKLDTQQQTMQHIGREIHDNVGQKLTLASLYAKQIQGDNPRITEIATIIDESLSELRQLSKSLANPELANLSLYNLLKDEADRINLTGVCHISIVQRGGMLTLTPSGKNILFRMLQEFIQNSLKHAACRKINISIYCDLEKQVITAEDDGRGFDPTIAGNGIGLQNMKRRADQINLAYLLESSPGTGTRLKLEWKHEI